MAIVQDSAKIRDDFSENALAGDGGWYTVFPNLGQLHNRQWSELILDFFPLSGSGVSVSLFGRALGRDVFEELKFRNYTSNLAITNKKVYLTGGSRYCGSANLRKAVASFLSCMPMGS